MCPAGCPVKQYNGVLGEVLSCYKDLITSVVTASKTVTVTIDYPIEGKQVEIYDAVTGEFLRHDGADSRLALSSEAGVAAWLSALRR